MKSAKKEIEVKVENIQRRLAARNNVIAAIRTGNLRMVIDALTLSFDDANMMVQLAWLKEVANNLPEKLLDNPSATRFSIVEREGAMMFHSSDKEDAIESLDQKIAETLALFSDPNLSEKTWMMLVALEVDSLEVNSFDIVRYLANIYKALFKTVRVHRILDEPMAQSILREKKPFFEVFSSCSGRGIWEWLFLNDSDQDKVAIMNKVLSLGWVDINATDAQGKRPLQLLLEYRMFLGDYVQKFFLCLIKNNADFNSLSAEEKDQLFPSLKYPKRGLDMLEEMITLDRADLCQYLVSGGVDVQRHHLEAAHDKPEILELFTTAGYSNVTATMM